MKADDLKNQPRSRIITILILGIILLLGSLFTAWFWKHPLSGHGGLPFLKKVELPVSPFFQEDPRWASDALGASTDTLGSAGCAVTSAAMVLAYYGLRIDPKNLNQYLTTHEGYDGGLSSVASVNAGQGVLGAQSPSGLNVREDLSTGVTKPCTPQVEAGKNSWIKWEVAGTFPPNIAEKRYEDLPSYGLIDWNLLCGNPVIIRIRRPTGKTHFVVIMGKENFDYLIRDPGPQGVKGVYPFYQLGTPIEALRYYCKKI